MYKPLAGPNQIKTFDFKAIRIFIKFIIFKRPDFLKIRPGFTGITKHRPGFNENVQIITKLVQRWDVLLKTWTIFFGSMAEKW